MASSTIGKAFIRVAIDSSRVPKGLRATEKSAKAGLQGVQAHAKKGIQSLATYYQSLMSVVQKCVAPLAAITAAKSFANFGDRLSKQASRLAVPPAFLQQVEYLEHSLGLTEGSVETLLSKMNLLGAKATNGSKEALSALEKMGVTLEEFNNMSPEKRIETLLKAIENAGTEAEKQQIAFSVLGKNATQMMGLLRGGLSGYQRTLQDAAKYGMSFTNEQLRQGEEMAQSWYNLQTASKSVWNSIGLISARALLAKRLAAKKPEKPAKTSDAPDYARLAAEALSDQLGRGCRLLNGLRKRWVPLLSGSKSWMTQATAGHLWQCRSAQLASLPKPCCRFS